MSDFWSFAFSFPTGTEGIELAIVEALSEALIIMMRAFESSGKNENRSFSEEIKILFPLSKRTTKSLDEMRQHCDVSESIRRNLDCR